ncbi:inorganic pyrophosphatase TTM1 isoform X1 [Nicotiana tomentosiformis]|uniref:inorganic pyrophosphatase TTM1 isoform X1 n=1 Tax=Nicotiana tomentosiformis TaxID=4098 RepID=UPI00051C5906|nr:inorganic pyrophosphatase TTM1 isoform X1 [Nicotiana tomentosiformis]XP_009607875.1 inorganic pyrophosphatase TTM1 isoform X1 [Nicotiana tomentosiformis]XP_009607877.1 inorganic pyrophosphatase TTM1 isoform X1 [Nicotiana tomentosiformis]XP_009607878.1 inorganic pyrophosphatase TTM1 isoform X1 [Nicotiana tomentosiformis]
MAQDTLSSADSPRRRSGLLRDQVQLVKRSNSARYEIVPIQDQLSFEKGFFIVIRACQLLVQKNEGIVLVGVAGPSGAGKTVFTEKILNVMPSIAIINMDNYNDPSRIIDGNFDDPRLTDYETLLENIHGLKAGKPVQVPIYDFKSSSRVGYRTLEAPSSRIVIIEGIYALGEKLRPLLDLRVSVTGGVHFDLVKRVLRDIQRAGQEPEEIIQQISETVYPMYKAFIEPDLQTAHIKIINKFNPFAGFQNPTYVLKSTKTVTVDQIKAVFPNEHKEITEETYDIYLLPPGEDPEACQSYLRMRNKDGKYTLMFEEWVTDSPFIISPRITFEVSVRLLGGLMALGYSIATILKRSSHIFSDDKVCVKTDWLEQLNRRYVQVQGRDRLYVKFIADSLGLDASYIPRTYIEQIQLEKLLNDVMTVQALPDDLKTKLSIDDDLVSSPREALSRASADRRTKFLNRGIPHTYSIQREKHLSKLTKLAVNSRRYDGRIPDSPAPVANQGVVSQLSEQISTLTERMDEFTSRMEELNSKISVNKISASQQNLAVHAEACNGSAPTSLFVAGLGNGSLTGSLLPHSSSASQLARESSLMEEVLLIGRSQRQIMHQIDNLSNILRELNGERSRQGRMDRTEGMAEVVESIGVPLLLTLAIGGVGIFLFRTLSSQK